MLAAQLAAPLLWPGGPGGHTATGSMTAYDPETRVLTLTSATGSAGFHLSADARVWLGNRRLPVSKLAAHLGSQVTVSWSEVEGVRTTHTVRVSVDTAGRGQ